MSAIFDCGLRTAYVHRPTEYDDVTDKPTPAPEAFDIVAADFLELAERLDC